jgi:uncharacterized coiled-coil DUF342 family protein
MEKHSNPIEHLIEFAWASGADRFVVNNAKDELKKLREEIDKIKEKTKEWTEEVYRSNEFAVQQTNEYLEISKKLQSLNDCLAKPVAYARINDRGDLYDLRLINNPYIDQNTVVPLFRIN